jgi:hypothetical protein
MQNLVEYLDGCREGLREECGVEVDPNHRAVANTFRPGSGLEKSAKMTAVENGVSNEY